MFSQSVFYSKQHLIAITIEETCVQIQAGYIGATMSDLKEIR